MTINEVRYYLLQDVEELGKKLGFTLDSGNFHNVSLGQGQEVVAEQAMDTAAGMGHWVVLQVTDCLLTHYPSQHEWLPDVETE
ncbi:Dynein heavy chain 17, axonemal [Periplaneta americana]|uniref:Dynein heavy chain 17, axonemal n=1 Tax=Periplaneta americana TaxID=6978 RepID=A0ABQ8S1B2_PERAM|nr:Dynein heavy chain 17, axonemal [Periplaneta americana]